MANYYYYGRSSYPVILIGVVVGLIFMVTGIFSMIVTNSWVQKVKGETRVIQEDVLKNRRDIDGTEMEFAEEAVSHYLKFRGKRDAVTLFHKKMGEDGRYIKSHRDEILRMLQAGKSESEVKEKLKEFSVKSINIRLDQEDKIIKVLAGFTKGDGALKEDVLNLDDARKHLPSEVLRALKSDADLSAGAAGLLTETQDKIKNQKAVIDDLHKKTEEAIKTTKEKLLKRIQVFQELKENLFSKRSEFDKVFWEKNDKQNEQWDQYLDKSRGHIEEVRKRRKELSELDDQLFQMKKLIRARFVFTDNFQLLDPIDGMVLESYPELGFVIVDIGRKDGLREKQMFEVFRVKGRTRERTKGKVVVKTLDDHISICKIIEFNAKNPISKGDRVSDPIGDALPYDKKIRPRYAIRGLLSKGFSRALIKAMVENSGGDIIEELNETTNFLITGYEVSEDDLAITKLQGIKVIRVRDLASHLGMTRADVEKLEELSWNN